MPIDTRNRMLEERVKSLEAAVELLSEKLRKFEPTVCEFADVSSRLADKEAENVELASKIEVLETQIRDITGRVEAVSLGFTEYAEQWPKINSDDNNDFTEVRNPRNVRKNRLCKSTVENKVTFGTKLSNSTDNILVTGDSLSRGVGYKLKDQCGSLVEVKSVGGAKLEAVSSTVSQLPSDKNRNLVVVAGANSFKDQMTESLLQNYEKIIDNGKQVSKNVVIVGLVKRYDLGSSFERKRIVVNKSLKKMCRSKDVSFVEYEPERSRVHSDGLHLNFKGQIELGQAIFTELKKHFLV